MAKAEYQNTRSTRNQPAVQRPADGVVRSPTNPSGYQYTASERVRRSRGIVETVKIVRIVKG